MRARGEGTIYRRQDGRWCAQITVTKHDGSAGRRTVYGETQAEVRGKQAAARREAAAGVTRTSRPPTVDDYAQSWLAAKAAAVETGHLSPNTIFAAKSRSSPSGAVERSDTMPVRHSHA